MTRYVRTKPKKKEKWSAAAASAAIAAGAGLVTFYLARLFLAREALPDPVDEESSDAPGR